MHMRQVFIVSAAAALLLLAGPGGAGQWKLAEGERSWSFPRDHGAHPDYRTEWWYFTGQLVSSDGRLFGYQLTFFRFGASRDPRPAGSVWAVRDLYAAHFAVSDVAGGAFSYAERLSREGPGLAGASGGGLDVVVIDWSATTEGGAFVLAAREGDLELRLRLTPDGEPLLHGEDGLSRKGRARGQASWYASLTDLRTVGTIRSPGMSTPAAVTGWSWFDHEFGSGQLAENLVGWDWFALRLSDGRRLMIYLLRRRDGTVTPFSSGTLREADGSSRHLENRDFIVDVASRWRSPGSGALYPSSWRLALPAEGIELTLDPLLEDQELVTEQSTGVTYWEGAVRGAGRSGAAEVTVDGYVELTGYGGSLGGLF